MKTKKKPFDLIEEITIYLKLIWRLIKDRRIPFGLKIIPFVFTLYLPIPDFIVGPFDDVLLFTLGVFLFVQLCPKMIVEEHLNTLRTVIPGEWSEPKKGEDILEGKVEEVPLRRPTQSRKKSPHMKTDK